MTEQVTRHPISVHFTTKDVSQAISFYRDVLGFELDCCWPDEQKPMWASLRLDGQVIMFGAEMGGTGEAFFDAHHEAWKKAPGGGVMVYLLVDDVDKYYAEVCKRGAKPAMEPRNEFYGLRNFAIADQDGYCLFFYKNIEMTSCQSCGMPLTDAMPGQSFCEHCSDERGNLKPYEQILEGTISGYFMGMQGMERTEAEVAAKEHLSKMPAWACHPQI